MSLIQKKTFSFDDGNVGAEGVTGFNIYYALSPAVLDYGSPKISIPVVPGQTTYGVIIPDQLPLGEGTYQVGVCAVDAAGNESDIVVIASPFDFTAPSAPVNLRFS
jgi:hypothetical protein